MCEPKIHSHLTDKLPESHPLAYTSIGCKICTTPLHVSHNECMGTWIETGKGNFCFNCFIETLKKENEEQRGEPKFALSVIVDQEWELKDFPEEKRMNEDTLRLTKEQRYKLRQIKQEIAKLSEALLKCSTMLALELTILELDDIIENNTAEELEKELKK